MTALLALALAVLGAGLFAAGYLACLVRLRSAVDRLAALVEAQQASLTAIPATEVERRAEVAAWHRRQITTVLGRLDSYHLGQGRAAA